MAKMKTVTLNTVKLTYKLASCKCWFKFSHFVDIDDGISNRCEPIWKQLHLGLDDISRLC